MHKEAIGHRNPRWARGFAYANLGNKKNAAQCVSMETGF